MIFELTYSRFIGAIIAGIVLSCVMIMILSPSSTPAVTPEPIVIQETLTPQPTSITNQQLYISMKDVNDNIIVNGFCISVLFGIVGVIIMIISVIRMLFGRIYQ